MEHTEIESKEIAEKDLYSCCYHPPLDSPLAGRAPPAAVPPFVFLLCVSAQRTGSNSSRSELIYCIYRDKQAPPTCTASSTCTLACWMRASSAAETSSLGRSHLPQSVNIDISRHGRTANENIASIVAAATHLETRVTL